MHIFSAISATFSKSDHDAAAFVMLRGGADAVTGLGDD